MSEIANDESLGPSAPVCTFIKASIKPAISASSSSLEAALAFFTAFQRAVELKVINDFVKEFQKAELNSFGLPVFIFNASNLISARSCQAALLHEHFEKDSSVTSIILDCSEIESKLDFFAFIFDGILSKTSRKTENFTLNYDFSSFQRALNACSPPEEIVLIVEEASKLNLAYLEDFVQLWERNLSKFKKVPKLKFVLDDSVIFLGMKSSSRDRFQVKEVHLPLVLEIFDELLIEMVNFPDFPVILHPMLIEQLQLQSSIKSLDRLITEIKFILIGFFSKPHQPEKIVFSSVNFVFITTLLHNLQKLRPAALKLSPSKDFYSSCFSGKLTECQAFCEVISELKCLEPNDFVSLFKHEDHPETPKETLRNNFIIRLKAIIREKMIGAATKSSASKSAMKDEQLNLINFLSNGLEASLCEREALVVNDLKGNLRKAFDSDPLSALQVALKFPSFYLNCRKKNCCSSSTSVISCYTSSSLVKQLSLTTTHNQSGMLDTCLLYRLSLETCGRSINLLNWYNSFVSISGSKGPSPLLMARFFKSLNELQLIGMVSEFGKSRRKRKFVDRFNISDTLEVDFNN